MPATEPALKYRPEIDGLRTISVFSVLLYHAELYTGGVRIASGGYLGVDVFFVISGYLISSLLFREIRDSRYSIVNFYERRARRILPALFTVIACSFAAAFFLLISSSLLEFAHSAAATVFFASNFFFWLQDSYTAVASAYKPLLHTWSLAVEEQFYIFYPLAVWLAAKTKRVGIFLIALGVLSLATAEALSRLAPDANFYLLPSRIWELLAGASVAYREVWMSRPAKRRPWVAILGLVALLACLALFRIEWPHPSALTIIPVFATTLLLIYGQSGPVFCALSSGPMVFLGLLSYSIYLWHQPVFAFARVAKNGNLNAFETLGCIALVIILSWLSWRFIETPFRNRKLISAKTTWISAGLTSAIALCATSTVIVLQGLPARFPQMQTQAEVTPPWDLLRQDGQSCFQRDVGRNCNFPAAPGQPTWLLVGNSHMGTLQYAFWRSLSSENDGVVPLSMGACFFAKNTISVKEGKIYKCTIERQKDRAALIQQHPSSVVVLSGRLQSSLDGSDFSAVTGVTNKGKLPIFTPVNSSTSASANVVSTVTDLLTSGHKVVLIYPIPELGFDVRNLAKQRDASKEQSLTLSRKTFEARVERAHAVLNSIPDNPNLLRIYPERIFCDAKPNGVCRAQDAGGLLYFDDNHPSEYGAQVLVDEVMREAKSKFK